ncbi:MULTISPECIES: hypothetical protein [unclassified Synechococcus]|uniref:hypothetical protein n=1 Tax=unclassified Synechococcus TaxID=2626047 RepID=UPI0037D99386
MAACRRRSVAAQPDRSGIPAAGIQQSEPGLFNGILKLIRCQQQPLNSHSMAGLIPFTNGCLRLSDHTLLPHDPQRGNTWTLPYPYDDQARADAVVAFLQDRLGDEDAVATFQAFARLLVQRCRAKVFLELHGPANTGKTVLTNLLIALAGAKNTVSIDLEKLENRNLLFQTQKLRNMGLTVVSEAHGYNGSLNVLKALTGGDLIAADLRYSDQACDFVYDGMVLVTGNGPISTTDTSGAVNSRRRSLPVTKVVSAGERRPLLDADAHWGYSGDFVDQLSGFANWVLEISEAEAQAILACSTRSRAQLEAELAMTITTDPLAHWAEQMLVLTSNHLHGNRGSTMTELMPAGEMLISMTEVQPPDLRTTLTLAGIIAISRVQASS